MIVVCDMGPIHYLVLIRAVEILPRIFTRILTPVAVIVEMSHPDTPEPVRLWAASPPQWLEITEPDHIEDIPSLGKKSMRGAGEKAAIALAQEVRANAILMDDKTGQRESRKRGLRPVWTLSVLDDAAERGFVSDLPEKLDFLVQNTRFYVGRECKQVIDGMKERDSRRKLTKRQIESDGNVDISGSVKQESSVRVRKQITQPIQPSFPHRTVFADPLLQGRKTNGFDAAGADPPDFLGVN